MGEDKGEVKVPAFLTKLFRYVQSQRATYYRLTCRGSMVTDSATDELIYWSDTGTSFFGGSPHLVGMVQLC